MEERITSTGALPDKKSVRRCGGKMGGNTTVDDHKATRHRSLGHEANKNKSRVGE
jgi:hypothetical protein